LSASPTKETQKKSLRISRAAEARSASLPYVRIVFAARTIPAVPGRIHAPAGPAHNGTVTIRTQPRNS
jgi:hypothetical protein